jgi:transposase-like protein
VIRINGQQFWLYAAVDPEINKFLHVRHFTTTTTALTQQFLRELRKKHDIENAVFLVDYAQHSLLHCNEQDSNFRQSATERGMLSTVSFER